MSPSDSLPLPTLQTTTPAKINLGLEVHHRRESDGYHYISSIFVPISYADRLKLTPIDGSTSRLKSINLLPESRRAAYEAVSESGNPADNLILRAIGAIAPWCHQAWHITIEKRIPPGAGLGGGSANAAAILRLLRHPEWWGSGDPSHVTATIEEHELKRVALQLGADVPFFLSKGAQLVTGIGEEMVPIALPSAQPLLGVAAIPDLTISTPFAYSQLKRDLHSAPPPKKMSSLTPEVAVALERGHLRTLQGRVVNHFAAALYEHYPLLAQLERAFLDSGAHYAALSGSGSTVYGLVSSRNDQLRLWQSMARQFLNCHFEPFESVNQPHWAVAKR